MRVPPPELNIATSGVPPVFVRVFRILPRRVLLLALVAACTGTKDTPAFDALPTAPLDPRESLCATAEADAATGPPRFEQMQAIFDQSCVSCHTTGADLDLSPRVAWGALVNRPAPNAEPCGGTLVVPRNPDASYLFVKLASAHPCTGVRMPLGEFGPEPLPDCVIALVRTWIAGGATGPIQDAGGD